MLIDTQVVSDPLPNTLFIAAPEAAQNRSVKLSLERQELRTELDLLADVVEAKQPLFSHLLLEAKRESVRLRAVGRYHTLQCDVAAQVKQTGSLCLPARKFAEIVRHLPAPNINLTSQAETATLQCGDSRFTLKTQTADTLPALSQATETIATVPSEVLLSMLQAASVAVARTTETGRYSLEGVQLKLSPTGLHVLATDGHRLLCAERADITHATTMTVFLARHSLPLLLKLLRAHAGEVQLSRNSNHLFFQLHTRLLICLLREGAFPECEPILAQGFQHELTLDGAMFQTVIERMAVLGANQASTSFGIIKFQFAANGEAGAYEVQSFDPSGSEGCEEIIPLTTNATEAITLSFNGRYLLDFARATASSSFTIRYNDVHSSIEIAPTTDDGSSVRYILMPCLG